MRWLLDVLSFEVNCSSSHKMDATANIVSSKIVYSGEYKFPILFRRCGLNPTELELSKIKVNA